MRAHDLLILRQQRWHLAVLTNIDIEVVQPKVGHHRFELPVAVDVAQQPRPEDLVGKHAVGSGKGRQRLPLQRRQAVIEFGPVAVQTFAQGNQLRGRHAQDLAVALIGSELQEGIGLRLRHRCNALLQVPLRRVRYTHNRGPLGIGHARARRFALRGGVRHPRRARRSRTRFCLLPHLVELHLIGDYRMGFRVFGKAAVLRKLSNHRWGGVSLQPLLLRHLQRRIHAEPIVERTVVDALRCELSLKPRIHAHLPHLRGLPGPGTEGEPLQKEAGFVDLLSYRFLGRSRDRQRPRK